MPLEKITQVSGRAVYVPGDDIDTDRIIPARFMKCVTFDGLGAFLFYDVRHQADGGKTAHNLNDPRFAGAEILLSGNNFGCGSSREHAPQAIAKAGFRAVIAESFAEIFFGNATQLGMPCLSITSDDRNLLAAAIEASPEDNLTLDLERMEIRFGSLTLSATMRESAREALMTGRWDPLGDLLEGLPEVETRVNALGYSR
jgi:3-isopropylmalate/(R)-2-methylmalate dehydratase small subunit